jgi:hypothetical protein
MNHHPRHPSGKSSRHNPGTLGTLPFLREGGAPSNRAAPFSARPLPISGQSAKSGLNAPVAQLDRALPSEGKGHTFESCRVRQIDPSPQDYAPNGWHRLAMSDPEWPKPI